MNSNVSDKYYVININRQNITLMVIIFLKKHKL